jgi:hypothetical protein
VNNPDSILPQPPAGPQKTNPWVIVVLVLVLLCCCCAGAIGLLIAFGEPVLTALGITQSWLPGLIGIL